MKRELRTSTSRAVAVFLAVAGSAMAIAGVPVAAATASAAEAFPCEENLHHQGGGMCTKVETRPLTLEDGPHKPFYTYCPAQYPFPAQGAFSGNPIWEDKSVSNPYSSEHIYLRIKAVSSTPHAKDFLGEYLSYAGTSDTDPGYVSLVRSNESEPGYHAVFECSNVPAA